MKRIKLLEVFVFLGFFLFSSAGLAQEIFTGDLVKVEALIYGESQGGAVLERLNRVENMLFGRTLPGTVVERQKRLIEFVFEGVEGEYPLAFKIASLEWFVLREVISGPLASRIDKLEEMVLGQKRGDKPMAWRVENLIKICISTGEIKMEEVNLPKGQLIKVSLLTPMDSRQNKAGDVVKVKVLEDLIYNGILVVPKGATGVGEIIKVERAGAFGKAGKIDVKFKYVESLVGKEIPVYVGERAAEETKKEVEGRAWAAITSFVGLGVFGPIGLVAGAFVHGEEAKIAAGTKFYLEVSEDIRIKGLLTDKVQKEENKRVEEVEPEVDEEPDNKEKSKTKEKPESKKIK
ncbi:MAG: hypothetical protein N3C62_04455 [Synergistetes bacterium]|nr:hypothetical protein [Synergistota bacterium]MCX8127965.1 hypothetical protein [Synergistota bacterium]MDW8192840.1 hypothetical protein [Synergistota bacterium]